jgi:hypothetical protein
MSVNESDSELTSEGGEKDASGDGEDAEGEDVEENDAEKEEAEADAEEGAGVYPFNSVRVLTDDFSLWSLTHPRVS